jgi:hypothetical protein
VEPDPAPTPTIDVSSDDSDDSGSDEDIPARVDPAKLLNDSLLSGKQSQPAVAKPQPEPEGQDEEMKDAEEQDEDVEMASSHSSPRESRSPVIFNQHITLLKPAAALELPKSAEDVEMESGSDSSSAEDDEEVDEDEKETSSDEKDEDEEETEEKNTIQIPRSSLELPHANSQPARSSGSQKQRKNQLIPSDDESNTQDEIDYQLTSSMYEVHSSSASQEAVKSPPPTQVPTSSIRPTFKIGASLQSLNEKSKNLSSNGKSSSQPGTTGTMANGRWQLKSDDEEETEDEESSSDESSDGEKAAAFAAQLTHAQSIPLPDSDSESRSSDDEDSDSEVQNIRNELAADVARMARTSSQVSSKPYPPTSSSQQQQQPEKEKAAAAAAGKDRSRVAGKDLAMEEKKKRDSKYLNGYKFSQIA